MFTLEDFNSIDQSYFEIIQTGGYSITIRSKNTGHCWHILQQTYTYKCRCLIYHNHNNYGIYHLHGRASNLQVAIRRIMRHDEYQLRKNEYRYDDKEGEDFFYE